MSRRLVFTLLIPILILAATAIVITLGRGYRLDIDQKGVKPTGILVATSDPNGAQVFLNGKFTAATNSNINLEPNWYEVKIHKDGYQDWNKKMRLQGEVVVKTDAVLFPSNPALSPLTTTGVTDPILSPDGTKIAFTATPSAQPATNPALPAGGQLPATYILDLTSRALSLNKNPRPYEGTLGQLLKQWQLEAASLKRLGLSRLPENFLKVATASAQILSFSEDESKVLYQATASATLAKIIEPPLIGANPTEETRDLKPDKIYVYDIREDRNYEIMKDSNQLSESPQDGESAPKRGMENLPKLASPLTKRLVQIFSKRVRLNVQSFAQERTSDPFYGAPSQLDRRRALQWLSTSRHLVLVEENKISILEYDGTNKVAVYSAPFENSFVFPHPTGRELIILTTLNPEANPIPNLYTLNLR